LIVTPWFSLKLLRRHSAGDHPAGDEKAADQVRASRLERLFNRLMRPFLSGRSGMRRRRLLFVALTACVLLAVALVAVGAVVMKMLPFDNKSEFQVVVDLPEGSTLETTNRLLIDLATALEGVPEVENIQGYAGTSAPINFNGLVRQYYLRQGANAGDLQVNLLDKRLRTRKSHEIAFAARPQLAEIGKRYGASIKVVEVPPGPPVLAPIVAEVYGPDYARSRAAAKDLESRFHATADVVDIDTSVEADSPRQIVVIDRERAANVGLDQAAIVAALRTALAGTDATYLQDGRSKYAIPVRLHLSAAAQASGCRRNGRDRGIWNAGMRSS